MIKIKNYHNIYSIVKLLSFIIGRRNVARLLMWIKYQLSFKKYYIGYKSIPKTVIFIVDGKTHHGGLSDRLRGLFSVYYYCKQRGYKFKVAWNYPFDLQNYLMPANENWVASSCDLIKNRQLVSFRFFNSYTPIANQEYDYFKLLDFKKPIAHVYSNFTLRKDLFPCFFKELFVLSPDIQKDFDKHYSAIGTDYCSITFRFVALLGDFKDTDDDRFHELNKESDKEDYIEHCLNAIKSIYDKFKKKIFITSDSIRFLNHVTSIPYVYTIPGEVTNMDRYHNASHEIYKKCSLTF